MSRLRRLVAPCALAVAIGAGCTEDGGRTEAFCADLRQNATALMNPALTTQADVEAYLALHDEIGDQVPLAIEEDWSVYAGALETAATVVPGDDAAAEDARRAIFAAEESAFRVVDWVNANCGLDLAAAGPVARQNPAVTTTTTASTTAAGSTTTTTTG